MHSTILNIRVTCAARPAIEEATYRGAGTNATASFTLPQAIVVAEAAEYGIKRREREGKDIATVGPVSTTLVGRAG